MFSARYRLLLAVLPLALPIGAAAAAPEATPDQMISTMEATFGIHPGERRNHIKGTCAAGTFVGLPAAARYTRAALFSGASVPVTARFSLPGGNPAIADGSRTPRGMALEFTLPDGTRHHMTMLNTPLFGASSPRTVLEDIASRQPDPATGKPDPERIKAFRARHTERNPQAEFLTANNPPISWANDSYFGIHTFRFIDREGQTTLVRWRFVPEDGEKRLSDDELTTLPPDFLEQRLIERTRQGPIRWDMMLTIGMPGDPETDPTLPWPADRQEIKIGTLSLADATPQKGAPCEKINYDPLVMVDGIEPTDDPVLLFRSPAYAISFAKRINGN